jgi:glycosyltransferase involved in cell wall biosynthesis
MSATPQTRLPVSVVIVSKNGAKQLPRVIKSVRDWADEVIVGLTDREDNSEEIVTALGGRVHRLTWIGYRDTKNAVTEQARNTWILSLDHDEEVPAKLGNEIAAFVRAAETSSYVAAKFPRRTWFLNRWITHGDWYPDHCTRLFRRDRARWGGGAVHERLVYEGPVATLKTDLLHYSFDSIRHAVTKLLSTADLAAEQHNKDQVPLSRTAIFFRPCWGFFRSYVLKRGFLDGTPGLIVAGLAAVGRFTKYSRMYELQRARPPS